MRLEKQPHNEFEWEAILRAELGAEATSQVIRVEAVEPEEELPLAEAA